MVHAGSLESTQEARVALGYRLGQLLRFFRALQTSRVHYLWVRDCCECFVYKYTHALAAQ